jgi:hypothetical protein
LRRVGIAISLACALAVSSPIPTLRAQTLPQDAVNSPNNYPPPIPPREGPPPPGLSFQTAQEVALPGPLLEHPLRIDGDEIALPVAGGEGRVRLVPEPSFRVVPAREFTNGTFAEGDTNWVLSEDGLFRFRSLSEGRIEAEKLSEKTEEWRDAWTYRVGGAVLAAPVPDGGRLFFGSLDNQVYAVRADNGHLLWSVDVGARLSRPLAVWHGILQPDAEGEPPREYSLLIVVPDDGAGMVALDTYNGTRVAALRLPEFESGFVSPALVSPEIGVVVARQRYAPTDAVLMVYRLGIPEPPPDSDEEVAYNEATPSSDGETE